MKKIIFTIMLLMILFCAFAVNVSAEETSLNAPVVQFKLINHDKIALKWDAVDDADGYLIYRTDVKTRKTYKYTSPVSDTKVTVAKLSPETEYIFAVAPINKNGDDVTIGEKSSGTRLTTPKEWYYEADYDINYDKEVMKSRYYRRDYANTVEENINLGDIKAVKEIIYSDDWYYVIGEIAAINAWDDYPWTLYSGNNRHSCVARIKPDGTEKEILLDFYASEGWSYRYQVTDDAIYLQSYHSDIYDSYIDEYNNRLEKYYSFPEDCWLKKISLETGKVETLVSSCLINWFCCYDGYIYYEYDDKSALIKDTHLHMNKILFISDWYDKDNHKFLDDTRYNLYYCKINCNNGVNQLLAKYQSDFITSSVYISDKIILRKSNQTIYVSLLNNNKCTKIYEGKYLIRETKIVNNYIYFTEIIDTRDNKVRYCRMKTNGSELTKKDKPFEWYY